MLELAADLGLELVAVVPVLAAPYFIRRTSP
jgi:hypothetical protein